MLAQSDIGDPIEVSDNLGAIFDLASPDALFYSLVSPSETFKCQTCGTVLIEKYHPTSFVNIGFRCFSCKSMTRTPSFDDPEVVPSRRVVLCKSNGVYRIEGRKIYNPLTIFCDQRTFELHSKKTAPRETHTDQLNLSTDKIDYLKDKYSLVTGVDVDRKYKELKRFHQNKSSGERDLPLIWSFYTLETAASKGEINLYVSAHRRALQTLTLFNYVLNAWSHVPLFDDVMIELKNDQQFMHNIALFLVMERMYYEGLHLSLNPRGARGTPDLYLKPSPITKMYLELKAPKNLQVYSQDKYDLKKIKKTVREEIAKKKQINFNSPGVFAFLIDGFESELIDHIRSEVINLFDSKRTKFMHVQSVFLVAVSGIATDRVFYKKEHFNDMKVIIRVYFEIINNKFRFSETLY